jgi:PQQ-dependent dehydrogenase (methanol/ethanol family)
VITDARLVAADGEINNWLTHGRTYSEQRFSPLSHISDQNVAELGLAWYYDLDYDRGVEATPIVADGTLYTTGSWSVVYAFDAGSGDLLWKYDPQVPRSWAPNACCDVVNRGVAIWGDKVYVGTLDGYLVALNSATGEVAWRVLTIDQNRPYTITGAPRVIKGRVIIGNGGADLGVRGYVSAYDVETGDLAWRFYTVPGNPAEPFESDALEMAADTWRGGEWWVIGGGGTVWDAMAFDPELDLLYIGVGNGAPWSRRLRSPGGGDNLFLSSIVALRPDTGTYVWHYQTTPGDSWDYTATQHIILADISIDGEQRKVLMQAPKNGFFYVIDRTTGEFISANNYVPVNWASHVDPDSGRPVINEDAFYDVEPRFTIPGPAGAHNWHSMAYSPVTGLVYIPAQEMPFAFGMDTDFEYRPGRWNLGVDMLHVAGPEDPEVLEPLLGLLKGRILAWDPVKQQAAWSVEHAGPWNGGLVATAGNLLFQGKPSGEFAAYRADNGEKLWSFDTQTGAVAAPITYTVGDEQYVAITVGWGTGLATLGGEAVRRLEVRNKSRTLAFKLGGTEQLPPLQPPVRVVPPEPLDIVLDEAQVSRGKRLYYGLGNCLICHGDGAISGGLMPDLRYANIATHDRWNAIVLGGERAVLGMPGYGDLLSESDSQALQTYVLSRARALREQLAMQE